VDVVKETPNKKRGRGRPPKGSHPIKRPPAKRPKTTAKGPGRPKKLENYDFRRSNRIAEREQSSIAIQESLLLCHTEILEVKTVMREMKAEVKEIKETVGKIMDAFFLSTPSPSSPLLSHPLLSPLNSHSSPLSNKH